MRGDGEVRCCDADDVQPVTSGQWPVADASLGRFILLPMLQ